ncbi:MAG: hypothetical protein [Circular genetic element sp.]|nr:MAG: hypothetical protein [Circular genetic element sp.]
MSLAPSLSVSRVKEGYIYGWSGTKALTSSALTLLDYTNPSEFFLTRVMLGIDWTSMGAGETLSYTLQVDGQSMFTEKIVIVDFNLGVQPKMIEFVIPPNSTVAVKATQSGNNGSISCVLTGYKV